MKKILVVACDNIRDKHCIACLKCFKALARREGEFARYKDEEVQVVGWTTCGGCPGMVIPRVLLTKELSELYGNEFDVIHLGTCMVKATSICNCSINLEELKQKLENLFGKEVVIGTHNY
ncbi:MAG: CGGC domain-containing protein [Candidatus Desulfofervidaceae bacterium]|nr:CGGC domain-containing protein [Candidatus Desulfofervidaceae bacterium]MDL1970739.1 CGGC domain-containing protein [Candidatus Desulfofervidaceae bacterium]